MLAEFAVAVWIKWLEHLAIFGIANINAAIWRVEGAVAGHAGWADTVESIAAIFDAEEEVARFATHTEEVAWLIDRKVAITEFENFFGVFFHGVEAADAVAVNILLSHELGAFFAKVGKETALNDGKKILVWLAILARFG